MAVFGIDLGTTNSVIARLDGGKPVPIAIAGDPIVPSVVLFREGETIVGRPARNLALQFPHEVVRSAKRQMGTDHRYRIGGLELTPQQVSAAVLAELKRGAEEASGEEVRDVVITVPAYFDDAQRRATLEAGELAGLHVIRLLNEPTSAALVYEQALVESGASEMLMVYDLGGGTFDVSILEISGSVREVRSTTGNTRLGGDDFDELLVKRFLEEILDADGVDLAGDTVAMARLRRLAEETKIRLSADTAAEAKAEFLFAARSGPIHLDTVVTRRDLEALIAPPVQDTIALCRKAIADAKLGEQALDRICLVGGSTRIPMVRAALEDAFGVPVHEEIDPDLAVGLGAAVQAGLLAGEPVSRILVDVASHTLGIRAIGMHDEDFDEADTFAPVLRRNTVLPATRTEEFYTAVDDQEMIEVEVYQGEAGRCSLNARVGSFMFDLEPAPALAPVRVQFAYDLNGVVKVSVTQTGSANSKTVALSVADATAGNSATAGKGGAGKATAPEDPLAMKARSLAESLPADLGSRLSSLLATYEGAADAARTRAEEELLDFLFEHEDDALVAEAP